MKVNLFTIAFILVSSTLFGQTSKTIDSTSFEKKIINYSIDINGGIFLAFEGGSITKYSANFDSLFTYSPSKVGDVTLLESGSGLVIFAFYDFFQEYVLTDRFLSRPTRTQLSNSSIDYVDIATQSSDNNIWLVENSGFRLIKYNVALKRIEFETALNTIIDSSNSNLTFIKEYQNQVFLVDENSGIYIFDNLGNFSKLLPATTNKCSFYKTEMVYIDNRKIVEVDIYSNTRKETPLTDSHNIGIMKHSDNTYLVSPTSLIRTN